MPITRKSRRYMTPLARKLAVLHNEAAKLANRLRNLAGDVQEIEVGNSHLRGTIEAVNVELARKHKRKQSIMPKGDT